GAIGEVYLYQGDKFITRASKIERYQRSKAERTDEDERIRTNQAKRSAHFYKMEKDAMSKHITRNLAVIKSEPDIFKNIVAEIVKQPEPKSDTTNADIENDIEYYTSAKYKKRAITDI
ncbi:MAG: hypothetical protein NT004_06335, partial [Bacteroidetes bacterium]|nr:hypothetical protein [Bacteroidota bacterium]